MPSGRGHPALRERAGGLRRGMAEHDLLTSASAASFQILTAVVPLALFGFALVAALGLEHVWRDSLAPDLRDAVSRPAYELVNDAVLRVFGSRRFFWLTAGALLAVWEVSGAVRTSMGALDRIYGGSGRLGLRRYAVSLALSVPLTALVLLAAASLHFASGLLSLDGGGVSGVVSTAVRYGIAALALYVAVVLVVRFAPETRQPLRWVTAGALLTVLLWLVSSALFGLYLTGIADYGSVFGSLASIFVLLVYLYVSSVVFFAGLQLDAMIRQDAEGSPTGDARSRAR
jgi:membrane protein